VKNATWIITTQRTAELISNAHIAMEKDIPMIIVEGERTLLKVDKQDRKQII